MVDARRWFRLELAPTGAVLGCREVDRAERDGSHVFFVRARNSDEAIAAVSRIHHRNVQNVRRGRLIAEGKCPWCSLKNDRDPGRRCSRCLGVQRKEKERSDGRETAARLGLPVPAKLPRANSRGIRRELLIEVRDAWRTATSNTAFTKWLDAEIASAGERLGIVKQQKTGT